MGFVVEVESIPVAAEFLIESGEVDGGELVGGIEPGGLFVLVGEFEGLLVVAV